MHSWMGVRKKEKKTRDDDIKVDKPKVTEITEESIKNGLTEISTRLSVLQPFVPDAPKDVASALNDQSMFSRQNTKQPHCKTCHHQRKGHTCPKGKKKESICPSCPGNICSTDGRGNPCKCDWHTTNIEGSMEEPYRGFYSTLHDAGIQELLLPAKASQSGFAGEPINSCTIIATLACLYTYKGCLSRKDVLEDHLALVQNYCNVIKIGNLR